MSAELSSKLNNALVGVKLNASQSSASSNSANAQTHASGKAVNHPFVEKLAQSLPQQRGQSLSRVNKLNLSHSMSLRAPSESSGVADKSTKKLGLGLSTIVCRGLKKAAALKKAQLSMEQQFKH